MREMDRIVDHQCQIQNFVLWT